MEVTSKWVIFFILNCVFVISCVFLQTWIQISARFQAMLEIVKQKQVNGVNTSSGNGSGSVSCVDRKDLNYYQIVPKVCSSS